MVLDTRRITFREKIPKIQYNAISLYNLWKERHEENQNLD
jgi:hypothetical protein